MKALTLKAPWGTAIARLGKDIENRSWKPPVSILGERIAIHQGEALAREGLRLLEEEYGEIEVEHGLIVCTAVLRGWVDADGEHSDTLTGREAARARRSEWFGGPVGWVLGSVRRPKGRVSTKGMLGLWTLPTRVANRLR